MKIIIDMKDLSDSREVMMSKVPMSISLFIYIMLGVIFSAVIWASAGQIDEYSTASGEIRPNESTGTLTAGSGGRVAKVNFEDGDLVSAGDVIIEFDATSIKEQKESLERQKREEEDRVRNFDRLKQSVETGQNLFSQSPEEEFFYYQYENYVLSLNQQIDQINQSNDKVASSKKEFELSISTTKEIISELNILLSEYKELYNSVSTGIAYNGSNSQLRLAYNDYIISYDKAKLTYDNYVIAYDNLVRRQREQSVAAANVISNSPDAADAGAAVTDVITQDMLDSAKYQVDTAEKDMLAVTSKFLVSIQSSIDDYDGQLTAQTTQLETYEIQLKNLTSDNSESAIREKAKSDMYLSINNSIDASNAQIKEMDNQLIGINESADNTDIAAQMSGVLVFLQDLISGDTIGPGTQIGKIVPSGAQLNTLLYVPEKDIVSIEPGLAVEYILNSISVSEYGKATGIILSVTADSFLDEASGQKYYKAEASIDNTVLTNSKGETRSLQTGMVVEARVISGSQSVLSWLLDRLNLKD